MRFDFVVNLKTARELGITFPNEIMLQVTEVVHPHQSRAPALSPRCV